MEMEITDILRVVAEDTQRQVLLLAAVFFGTILLALFLAHFFTPIIEWTKRRKLRAVWIASFVLACIYCGATKTPTGTITYPYTDPENRYLIGGDSYITNDYFHIQFTRNLVVPSSAWFYFEICPLSITNQDDWADNAICIYSNQFSNITLPLDLYYPAATNYNAIGYTDWVPGPVTHTNGVAYVTWAIGVGKMTNNIAITRTGVYTVIGSEEEGDDVIVNRVAPNPAITNSPPIPLSVNLSPNSEE